MAHNVRGGIGSIAATGLYSGDQRRPIGLEPKAVQRNIERVGKVFDFAAFLLGVVHGI
jgi:hypothetical protein